MTQPGSPWNRAPATDERAQVRRIKELTDRVARLESQALGPNGLVIGEGKSIASSDFDGDIDTLTPGEHGWALGGALAGGVFSALALANGIIGNDALANPIDPKTGHNDAANFALTTTPTEFARIPWTVPAGYTKALVMCSTDFRARNTTASVDGLGGYVDAYGISSGYDAIVDVMPGLLGHASNASAVLLVGLTPGSTIYARSMVYSLGANWPADSWNAVNTNAAVMFAR